MAIKRVVNKPKSETIKKFPEFDSSKIYVNSGYCDSEFDEVFR